MLHFAARSKKPATRRKPSIRFEGTSKVSNVRPQQIAALSATANQSTRSPFGEHDEIGMLNLITASSRRAILARADAGTVYDLSMDLFPGMPSWIYGGDLSFQIWLSHTPHGRLVDERMTSGRAAHETISDSGDTISMYTHCGTHIDTLNHYGYSGEIWNGFNERDHMGSRHWNVCGADKHPPIIARAVLIDVARAHGVNVLPDSYGIGEQDIREALTRQRVTVGLGDVVLLRTGRIRMWPDAGRFMLNEPGLNREGAEYLARQGAIIVGADNVALDQLPSPNPDNWLPVHTYLLAEAGVPIIEVLNLEELAAAKIYESAFVGAATRIRGATGAPIRPFVMPLL